MLQRLVFDGGMNVNHFRRLLLFKVIHADVVFHHKRACASFSPSVWTSKQIRKQFIDFFVTKYDHTFVPSSSVDLQNDPSLIFVNAGMNQFKPIFLQNTALIEKRFDNLKRVANSQKCIRTGGKHCDLENVGKDLHHHTFFEMLGNWSFGDYFKEDACRMAWELLTDVYRLPSEQLYVTYFGGDEKQDLPADLECRDVWLRLGVSEDHILPFGSEHNFWEMGETGPCGPCTEIHYDRLGSSGRERVNLGSNETVELWNLVFMQYHRLGNKTLKPLSRHHVDTGMGMERLTSILQNKNSNYDTDLFTPLLNTIHKNCSVRPYSGKVGEEDVGGIDATYRTIADHARAITVAISDGVLPNVHPAGHLLRQLMKRVFYSGHTVLKAPSGLLSNLADVVTSEMGESYPELSEKLSKVKSIITEEEEMYMKLLDKWSQAFLTKIKKSTDGMLSGRDAFRLYDFSGLSEKLIEEMASRLGLQVDWKNFRNLKASKEKEIRSYSPEANITILLQEAGIASTDDRFKYQRTYKNGCYEFGSLEAKVLSLMSGSNLIDEASERSNLAIILDRTNFYSESGGQVGDKGFIISDKFEFAVEDTTQHGSYVLHCGTLVRGTLRLGDVVVLKLDEDHRKGCMKNHTAAHLLHSAIKETLPDTIQKSCRIDSSKLDFEFSAKKSFKLDELRQIEEFVNTAIKTKMPVVTTLESEHGDLIVSPGETYSDLVMMVRIVDKGDDIISKEICCGTHVDNTSDLSMFTLTSQHRSRDSKSLTAVTGIAASDALRNCSSFELKTKQLSHDVSAATTTQPLEYLKLVDLLREIAQLGNSFPEVKLSIVKLQEMVESLNQLKQQCNAAIQRYNNVQLMESATAEWWRVVEEHKERMYVVCILKAEEDASSILKHLKDRFDCVKPAMALVCSGSGGFKKHTKSKMSEQKSVSLGHGPVVNSLLHSGPQIAFQCWVPEHCVSEKFNANLWASHIAGLIGADLYIPRIGSTMFACRIHHPVFLDGDEQLQQVFLAAKNFVETNI